MYILGMFSALAPLIFTWALAQSTNTLRVLSITIPGVFDESPPARERMIVEEMAKCMGKKISVTLVPYMRHISYFEAKDEVDAVATVPPDAKVVGYPTISHISYHNGASTLASFQKEINSPQDLKGLRVISFKGACSILPGMNEAVKSFASYEEMIDLDIHSKMLLLERVDAVVSDKYVFSVHTKRIRQQEPNRKEFFRATKFHPIFGPTPFRMSFKDKNLRDQFNKCVRENQDLISAINKKFEL